MLNRLPIEPNWGEKIKETIHTFTIDEKEYENLLIQTRDNKKVELTKDNTIYRGFITRISKFQTTDSNKYQVNITFIDVEKVEKKCSNCKYYPEFYNNEDMCALCLDKHNWKGKEKVLTKEEKSKNGCSECRFSCNVNKDYNHCPYLFGECDDNYSKFQPRTCGFCEHLDYTTQMTYKKESFECKKAVGTRYFNIEYVNKNCKYFKNRIKKKKELFPKVEVVEFEKPTLGWFDSTLKEEYILSEPIEQKGIKNIKLNPFLEICKTCNSHEFRGSLSISYCNKFKKVIVDTNTFYKWCNNNQNKCQHYSNRRLLWTDFMKERKKQILRDCIGCKYWSLGPYKEPCFSCVAHSKFKQEKNKNKNKNKKQKEETKMEWIEGTPCSECFYSKDGNSKEYNSTHVCWKEGSKRNEPTYHYKGHCCSMSFSVDSAISDCKFAKFRDYKKYKEVNKMEENKDVKKEIERVKEKIKEVKKNREKKLTEFRSFDYLFYKEKGLTSWHFHPIKEFRKWLREYKKIKIKKRIWFFQGIEMYNLYKLELENWKRVEKYIDICLKYREEYECYNSKKELCKLTDCYKALKNDKGKCVDCGCELQPKGKFCSQCGKEVSKNEN